MADESGESPLDIKAVLGVLEDNSSGERELVEAYDTILRHTSQQLSLFERDIVENGQRLVATTKKHIEQNKELLVPKALNVMGYCLNIKEIVGCVVLHISVLYDSKNGFKGHFCLCNLLE